jgi:hypothetical protein
MASRRAMMALPAPIDVERRLTVRVPDPHAASNIASATAEDAATDSAAASSSTAAAADDVVSDDEDGGGILTLGDGRVALEFAAANRTLRARVAQLEGLLASREAMLQQQPQVPSAAPAAAAASSSASSAAPSEALAAT